MKHTVESSVSLLYQAHRKTDMSMEEYCFLSCNTVESSFSSKVLRPIFGPWPLWRQGFETVEFLQGEDVNPMPNPKPRGSFTVSHSKSVQHVRPYQHLQWSLVEIYLYFGGTNFFNFFHHETGGSWFLHHAGKLLLYYVASHPRRLYSSQRLMREPQISECSQHM